MSALLSGLARRLPRVILSELPNAPLTDGPAAQPLPLPDDAPSAAIPARAPRAQQPPPVDSNQVTGEQGAHILFDQGVRNAGPGFDDLMSQSRLPRASATAPPATVIATQPMNDAGLAAQAPPSTGVNVPPSARLPSAVVSADAVNPTLTPIPAIPDHSQEHHSLLGEIGLHLRHAVKGAVMGGMVGGAPGMIGGALAGGISPRSVDEAEYYHKTLPRVMAQRHEQEAEADAAMKRAGDYAAITGHNPFDENNGLTPQGTLHAAQVANIGSEIDARDRQRTHDEAQLGVNQFKEWAATVAPGTKIPDNLADAAGVPRGGTVWHNTRTNEHYIHGQDGTTYQLKDGVGAVVTDAQGNPIRQYVPPLPREPQTPEFVFDGRARSELLKDHGINDENALVDNPAFGEAFDQQKAAETENAKQYGYPMPSDAQIATTVAKKTPRKVKAGSLITPDMVKQRAAEIYQREHTGKPVTPTAPHASPGSRQQQMSAHENEYQRLYPKLSADDRKKLEDAFKAQYGRQPRKPQ